MKKTLTLFLLVSLVFSLSTGLFAFDKNSDPADSYTQIKAANEDAKLSLWFEHAFEKIEQKNITPSGMDTYTIRMAKNEIEGVQFILASSEDKTGLTAEVTPFKNSDGVTLPAEIFKEHYQYAGKNISGEDQYNPDAIPPLMDAFDLKASKSQAFLIKTTTKIDTPAGQYEAMLTIKNADGQEIKQAKVFLKVWDFELSEETACSTAFWLSRNGMKTYHPGTTKTDAELYKEYYDYLLENRICAFSVPYDIETEEAQEYIENPRVTAFKLGGFEYEGNPYSETKLKKLYRLHKDDENWQKKGFFYLEDEPNNFDKLESLRQKASKVLEFYPTANIVSPYYYDFTMSDSPYYKDQDLTGIDQIEWMRDYVNIWCSKVYGYTENTPENLEEIAKNNPNGIRSIQTPEWDAKYGTFAERMTQYKEEGDKVWWYVCWRPSYPYYANVLHSDPGIMHRVLFWQQKQFNVDGLLYFYANAWATQSGNPWTSTVTNAGLNPIVYGDGLLVYPGGEVGIDGPVGSLRLEAVRDGIEDFQYMTMLENLVSRGALDELITNVSTNILKWNEDSDSFVQTRIALGDAVEEAVKKSNECPDGEHQGGEANCTDKAVCEICGTEYGELDPLNHNNVDGVCTRCGRRPGDVNKDGVIDENDVIRLLRYVSGVWKNVEVDESQADVNNDGTVDETDSIRLTRYYSGVWKGVIIE